MKPQLLHLVFGGELKSLDGVEFKDVGKLDIVGIYPNFAEAKVAWERRARETLAGRIDEETMRRMNEAVDIKRQDPAAVVREFLDRK